MGKPLLNRKRGCAFGNVTWMSLAKASWDVGEVMWMLLEKDEILLTGLAERWQVERLRVQRAQLSATCKPLLHDMPSHGLSLDIGRSISKRELLRQVWLSKLASRFALV